MNTRKSATGLYNEQLYALFVGAALANPHRPELIDMLIQASHSLADPMIARLWIELRRVAQNQRGKVEQVMDQYRTHRHEFEKISSAEVSEGLRNDQILLVDARPEDEYRAGHLPGAISLPVDAIPCRIHELKTVVTYCHGPVCADADDASVLQSAYGCPVKRLDDGVAV